MFLDLGEPYRAIGPQMKALWTPRLPLPSHLPIQDISMTSDKFAPSVRIKGTFISPPLKNPKIKPVGLNMFLLF